MAIPRYYTGIGSRSTPDEVLQQMQQLGAMLAQAGYTLRTGGARGADEAFMEGVTNAIGPYIVYVPWSGFNKYVANSCTDTVMVNQRTIVVTGNDPDAAQMAATGIMGWDSLTLGRQMQHTCEITQVLGAGLTSASEFVVCWMDDKEPWGSAVTATRLAQRVGVPVYNLAVAGELERVMRERAVL